MNKFNMARNVLRVLVALGVGSIVNNVVKATSPPPEGAINSLAHKTGKFALGGMIVAETVKYTDTKFNEIFAPQEPEQPKPEQNPIVVQPQQ